MKSPVLTRRLEKVPSTGARTDGESRDRARPWRARSAIPQAGAGLGLLRPRHLDVVARRVIGRLRRLHRRRCPGRGRPRRPRRSRARQNPWCSAPAGARNRARPASSAASAETSCALACSTALSSAVTCRPMRSMVACWVAILRARGIDRDAIVAVVDPEDHVARTDNRVVGGQDRRDVA